MKRMMVVLLLLIGFMNAYAGGGCGPAVVISNPVPKQYNIYRFVDTIRITLNPLDENISFELTQYDGDCQFLNSSWFKNGVPITGNNVKCVTSGAGIYTISTSNWGSSASNYTVRIIVTATVTSVDEEIAGSDIRIYPNPSAEGVFTMEKNGSSETTSIAIYDLNGQVIKKTKMEQQKITLDMSGFAKGIYFMEWTPTDGMKRRKKIIFD